MDPIKYIQKEKKHLARMKSMRLEIYRKIASVKLGVHKSAEPIKPAEKESLKYSPIAKGGFWAGLYGCAWFRVESAIPASAKGKHVVLHMNIGGEGLVFERGGQTPVAGITSVMTYLDRLAASVGKSVVEVAKKAEGGEKVEFFIDGGYNGYYNIPIGRGVLKYAELCSVDDGLKDFYYDYLTVTSLLSVTEDRLRASELEVALDKAFSLLGKRTEGEIAAAKKTFDFILQGKSDDSLTFTAVGHSHLDLAWLWPLRETKRKAARTFANQINNMSGYPEYIYGASQPQQFEYIEHKYPEQFQKLSEYIKNGQLEAQGGMWVESDTNVTSGEALLRQLFYGKKYFLERFGQEMKMCWLPDVFGYNGNLPQILKKSGLPYFMTIKLSWNEHNRFPYRSFVWRGIDGSDVLVHMAPDETYNSCGSPAGVKHAKDNYTEKHLAPEALMIYGVGDGGGGPGEAHIEMIKRQKTLLDSPKVQTGKAADFFDRLTTYADKLPSYDGELYLEKHQGTYTTQARNKKYNRKTEYALQDLETLSAYAYTKGLEYPQEKLDRWWKEILLYQFHDIIPGSSITRVYTESRERYRIVNEQIAAEKRAVYAFLAKNGGKTVFNPTSYSRKGCVFNDGKWICYQAEPYGFTQAQEISDVGEGLSCTKDSIENAFLKVKFNKAGEIVSLKDKKSEFEYAKEYLNRLRLYKDKPLYYNAWDIDWKYFEKPSKRLKASDSKTFVEGQKVVRRNIYRNGRTEIIQDVTLYADKGIVYFETKCEWHQLFKMLRADFTPAVFADKVKCDIQFGSFFRSTHDETPEEKAQFEICAHKYVDVSDGERGVSVLNDCKYGHRVKNGLISVNLLRSPIYPDSKADRGEHSFTYAFYPHSGACSEDTIVESYFLNKTVDIIDGKIDPVSIASVNGRAVVVETIKKAYGENAIIVRMYESLGEKAECALKTAFDYKSSLEATADEKDIAPVDVDKLTFAPYEIKTVKLVL